MIGNELREHAGDRWRVMVGADFGILSHGSFLIEFELVVDFDLARLDQLFPFGDIVLHVLAELLGRHRHRFQYVNSVSSISKMVNADSASRFRRA